MPADKRKKEKAKASMTRLKIVKKTPLAKTKGTVNKNTRSQLLHIDKERF